MSLSNSQRRDAQHRLERSLGPSRAADTIRTLERRLGPSRAADAMRDIAGGRSPRGLDPVTRRQVGRI